MLYELVCGSLPYGEVEEDPIKVYEAIMKKSIIFPE